MVDTTVVWNVVRIVIMIVSVVVVGAFAVGGVYMYMMWKRYQEYRVVLWEKDSMGNVHEIDDQGAVFADRKTGNVLFHLRKHKVPLSPDNIPFIKKGKTKLVYIVKYGLRDYRFIKPVVSDGGVGLVVGEKDINWAINTYQRVKKVMEGNNIMQFLPFILLAFVSIVILIIFIYFFKNFSVLKDVAVALNEAAQAIAANQATAQVVN